METKVIVQKHFETLNLGILDLSDNLTNISSCDQFQPRGSQKKAFCLSGWLVTLSIKLHFVLTSTDLSQKPFKSNNGVKS